MCAHLAPTLCLLLLEMMLQVKLLLLTSVWVVKTAPWITGTKNGCNRPREFSAIGCRRADRNASFHTNRSSMRSRRGRCKNNEEVRNCMQFCTTFMECDTLFEAISAELGCTCSCVSPRTSSPGPLSRRRKGDASSAGSGRGHRRTRSKSRALRAR